MPVGDPMAPVPYAWWVPVLGGALILVALLWVIYVLFLKGRRAQRSRDRVAPQLRVSYGSRLQELYQRFEVGHLDLRGFHLELAALVREFGSERMGRDLSVMSRGEVEMFYPRQGIGRLLARCEQPSFSRDSKAEALTSVQMAQEVIAQW